MVLHVPAGQLEPGVSDDGGSLQTQQPGVRRQTLHHRRTLRIREPGPRGEVRVTQNQQQPVSERLTPPAAPSWRLNSPTQLQPPFDSHLRERMRDNSAKVGGC